MRVVRHLIISVEEALVATPQRRLAEAPAKPLGQVIAIDEGLIKDHLNMWS